MVIRTIIATILFSLAIVNPSIASPFTQNLLKRASGKVASKESPIIVSREGAVTSTTVGGLMGLAVASGVFASAQASGTRIASTHQQSRSSRSGFDPIFYGLHR